MPRPIESQHWNWLDSHAILTPIGSLTLGEISMSTKLHFLVGILLIMVLTVSTAACGGDGDDSEDIPEEPLVLEAEWTGDPDYGVIARL